MRGWGWGVLPLEKSTTHKSTTLKDPAEFVYTRLRGSWLVDSLSILSSSVFTRNRDILLHVFFFFLSLIHFPFARRWDVSKSCLLSLSRSDLMERGISDSVQSLRLLLSCPHTDCHRKQVEEALLDWLVFNKSLVLTFLLLSFSQWWFFWFSVWMLDGAVI